jgi:co-chaperonin GroES (HSP10)
MRILDDYIVVRKVSSNEDIIMHERYIDEYQQCIVESVNHQSIYMSGDHILVGENIFFDKAPTFGDDTYFMYEDDVFGVIRGGNIIPRNDIVYIETDKNKNETIGNTGILRDISYNPLAKGNVVQDGKVVSVCSKAKDSYYYKPLEIEIYPGDHVYTHHFLTDKAFEREFNGRSYYEIRYEDIYCKVVNDEIQMLNEWNFVTPIQNDIRKTSDGIILEVSAKNEVRTGLMQHPCKGMELYPGDRCLFKRGREYEIDVEGHTYYRINKKDILYNLEQMKALGDIVVVRPQFKESEINGIIVRTKKDNMPEKGEVVSAGEDSALNEGDNILFRKAACTEVNIEGEELLLISSKNVYVVL